MEIYYVFFLLFYLFKIILSKITIHVIPHSHQNLGRLFDEYDYKKAHDILTNSIRHCMDSRRFPQSYRKESMNSQLHL